MVIFGAERRVKVSNYAYGHEQGDDGRLRWWERVGQSHHRQGSVLPGSGL